MLRSEYIPVFCSLFFLPMTSEILPHPEATATTREIRTALHRIQTLLQRYGQSRSLDAEFQTQLRRANADLITIFKGMNKLLQFTVSAS